MSVSKVGLEEAHIKEGSVTKLLSQLQHLKHKFLGLAATLVKFCAIKAVLARM